MYLCVCVSVSPVSASSTWTPRVGGAMRVGLEVSRVYSRQSVGQSVRLSCPVQWCRGALYWRLGLPSGRESGQRLATSNPCVDGPRGLRSLCPAWRRSDERSCHLAECLLACLPAYLPDLTIMNGHGAHRRQEGSQLAAEPACSRRVRAPSKPWGEGCLVADRGSYDKAGYVGMGLAGLSGQVMASLRVDTPTPPCPTPPAAHQLGRADKHGTVSREGSGITFL